MMTRSACVICSGQSLDSWAAVLSPFVAARIGSPPVACRLLECRGCGHRFFDRAYDEPEAMRLYQGYRGPAYFAARHAWEPWYTARVNDAIGGDLREIARRREQLDGFLRGHLPATVLAGSVLDYGGDRGQFMPTGIGTARFLYDVSGLPPVEGVTALRSEPELGAHHFDLVLVCHVLEHLADPVALLRALRDRLGPRSAGHWLYLEVPFERHRILKRRLPAGTGLPAAVPLVARHRASFVVLDFVSTLARVKFGLVPPGGLIKLHEHVNYFGAESLRRLLETVGLEVAHLDTAEAAPTAGIGRVLRAVARSR
jgi:SAM-dependent methyltransferase